MGDFSSENDPLWLGQWLKRQGVNPATITPDELKDLQDAFKDVRRVRKSSPKVWRIKFKPLDAGEQRYAVAIQDGSDLWLTMWVRCSPKGEIFIMYPRAGRHSGDPHASYHRDGTFYQKSHNRKIHPQKRQPLTADFRGSEHLGAYGGHGKGTGAICDPKAFDGLVSVGPGVLGPYRGSVVVDLVQPGYAPEPNPNVAGRRMFSRGARPSVVITICRDNEAIVFLNWPDDFREVVS